VKPRQAVAALAVLAGALGAGAGAASAANGDRVQCAPEDAWCIAVFHKTDHRIHLELAGFQVSGRYRLCVTPPKRSETCRSFTLRPQGNGANISSVIFTRNFPHATHGRYHVRWIYGGRQLGRTLAFRA
jgi:hypothetical protein